MSHSACVLLLSKGPTGWELILGKHGPAISPTNKWNLLGGQYNRDREDPLHAALRELYEESGYCDRRYAGRNICPAYTCRVNLGEPLGSTTIRHRDGNTVTVFILKEDPAKPFRCNNANGGWLGHVPSANKEVERISRFPLGDFVSQGHHFQGMLSLVGSRDEVTKEFDLTRFRLSGQEVEAVEVVSRVNMSINNLSRTLAAL